MITQSQINRYITLWQNRCYSELPDEAPREIDDMVPSYRRITMAILRGDLYLIGITPPQSDYYGMLKAIELNKPYQKSKNMTQSELRQFIFKLINTLIEKSCYIKGYGNQFRIMDGAHNPIRNISKQEMNVLLFNDVVCKSGLIYVLNILANKFTHPIDIKLPTKDDNP